MLYTDLTKKAIRLMFHAHKDQLDKSGMPYVFHPFHLAEQMHTEFETVTALLHDVAEDSHYALQDIRSMGFPEEVLAALHLLTHDTEVPYMDYIEAIRENPIARKVKIADLKHNSDLSRLESVDEWALARSRKYAQALALLEAD